VKQLRRSVLPLISIVLLFTGALIAQSSVPSGQQSPDQQPTTTDQQNSSAEQQSNAAGESQTLIDPGVIYNSKKAGTWIGKIVTLKNVMVQDTNKSGNFWVGSDDHHRLLIVKPTSDLELNALRVHKGDVVTVTGEIQAASQALADKNGAEKGSLRDAENRSGVFLLANRVNIGSSTQH
jgi:hypothetical protein